jgi:hypothetical protein
MTLDNVAREWRARARLRTGRASGIGWQSYKIPLEHWHFNTFRGTTVPGAPLAGAMATFQLDARAMPSALELSGLATFNPKAPSP